MDTENFSSLVERIDVLIGRFLEARPPRVDRMVFMGDLSLEDILEGDDLRSDPSTLPRLALRTIGETLGLVGGPKLMVSVYEAYKARYGARRATYLDQQWYGAAGMWG